MKIAENSFFILVQDIKRLIRNARYTALNAVNAEMLKAYYEIGRRIVEDEQKGETRAEYGEKVLESLSGELNKEFRRGYGVTTLKNMRLFYLVYKDKISQSVTDEFFKLTWAHYCELIKIEDEMNQFYETYNGSEKPSKLLRELTRINSCLQTT